MNITDEMLSAYRAALPTEDEERKCSGNGRCAGDLLCCSCTDAP
jgi:hypothetical protein